MSVLGFVMAQSEGPTATHCTTTVMCVGGTWCEQTTSLSTQVFFLKPLWSGMGEVVPARTSLTLHPPSPPTVHQLSRLAL